MSLEILFNSAKNTHENEQFRRVVEIIKLTFEKNSFSGILIGNPHNDKYPKFSSDAILIYTKGIIAIDFKDYGGEIVFGEKNTELDFCKNEWYNKTEKGNILVKGGSSINPYAQLQKHRLAFQQLINKINNYEQEKIDSKYICYVNIFSRKLILPTIYYEKIEKEKKFYKIKSEDELSNFLYDYANTYDNFNFNKFGQILKKFFPAKKWYDSNDYKKIDNNIDEPKQNIQDEIINFLRQDNKKILILKTMNAEEKTIWTNFILDKYTNYKIPQIENLSLKSQVCKKLWDLEITSSSIYSEIYDFNNEIEEIEEFEETENIYNEENNDNEKERIIRYPLLKNNTHNKSLFVINEANLITSHYAATDFIHFGSDRLLNDLYEFIDLKSERKIILIGDPFILFPASSEKKENALNNVDENITSVCDIACTEELDIYENTDSILTLRRDLARSIRNEIFNSLNYNFDNKKLYEINQERKLELIKEKFSLPLEDKPNTILVFCTNEQCLDQNLWIKENCLHNGNNLAPGDLLITSNYYDFCDKGEQYSNNRLLFGSFVRVVKVMESKIEPIKPKGYKKEINLEFQKITIKILNSYIEQEIDVWILLDFLKSKDDYVKGDIKRALIILKNMRVKKELKNSEHFPIRDKIYSQIEQDERYKNLQYEEQQAIRNLIKKDCGDVSIKKVTTTEVARKLFYEYKHKYELKIEEYIKKTDPIVSHLKVKYGWAVTNYKKMFDKFDNVIVDSTGFNSNTCEQYFRWLYTAITETKKVYIVNPVKINPFTKSEISKEIVSFNRKLRFDEYYILNNYNYYLKDFPNNIDKRIDITLRAIICEVLKKYDNIKFSGLEIKSQYLSVIKFNNGDFILNVNNDKDFYVTSINPLYKKGNIYKEEINNIIKNLDNIPIDTLKDFRKDIYNKLSCEAEAKDINIQLIKINEYKDIFRVISNQTGEETFLSLIYNKNGFFSNITVSKSCSEELYKKIEELFTKWKN